MPIIFEGAPRTRNEPDRPTVPLDELSGRPLDPLPEPPPPRERGWWEAFVDYGAAAARQGSFAGGMAEYARNYGFGSPPPVPGYDPANDIAGYEDRWRAFVDADSPEETARIKMQLDQYDRDMEVLRSAPGRGLPWLILMGMADLPTLVSMMIPVAAPEVIGSKAAVAAGTATRLTRAQRVWSMVAAQAAADTAAEVGFHKVNIARTLNDSLINVGSGAILTGALGALATRVPKSELEAAIQQANEARRAEHAAAQANTSGTGSLGAARIGDQTTLEDEGVAYGGRFLARTLGQISPTTRGLQSPVKYVRQLTQRLSHIPYLLQKNLRGIKSETSIEDVILRARQQARQQARYMLDTEWAKYRAGGGQLSRKLFAEEVGTAATRGDKSAIPEAAAVARWWRQLTDSHVAELRKLPDWQKFAEGAPLGAESYFRRIYDLEKIMHDMGGFRRMAFNWMKANPKIPKEGAVDPARVAAEKRAGVSDAVINLEIAQRDADEAAAAYRKAQREFATARAAATGKGGAKQKAYGAKRTMQAKRREAGKLNHKLKALEKRLKALQEKAEPRAPDAIEQDLAAAVKQRKEVKPKIAEIKAVGQKAAATARKLAVRVRSMERGVQRLAAKIDEMMGGEVSAETFRKLDRLQTQLAKQQTALDAAKQDLASMRAQVNEAATRLAKLRESEETWAQTVADLRTEKQIGQAQGNALDVAQNRRNQILNRATEATDELQDAERVAKRLKEEAKAARKLVRALKQPKKLAKKAATKAAGIARKARLPEQEDAEIWQRVDDMIRNIFGDEIQPAPGQTVSSANSLKERVVDIPDELLAPYMVRDFERVVDSYIRKIVPEIELRKRFGSITLQAEKQLIKDEYTLLRNQVLDNPKALQALDDRETADLAGVDTLVRRLMGQTGSRTTSPVIRKLIRAARVARTYNYIRLLGSQTLSSLSDYGKLVARYGLPRTMAKTARFLADSDFRKLSLANQNRLGNALELVVDARLQQMGDMVDELPVTRFQRGMEQATNLYSRVSGMAYWNASMKTLGGLLEQDQLVRSLRRPSGLSKFERGQLLRAGIDDDMSKRLLAMIDQHADDTDGVWRARSELWEDREAAELFERHIINTADELLITRGVGDLPGVMDNELAKLILQFRTFALASVNRTMIPMAQGLAQLDANTIQGVASMMALGSMTYYVKEIAQGRDPDLSPERLVAEAFNWSGLIGPVPDLWDPIALLHEDLPRFSRFMSRSPQETLLGPTIGTGVNAWFGTLHDLVDGEFKQEDVHQIRRLLPMQNLFYVSRLFNAIEGETGEALGAQDAKTMTFTERLKETRPSKENRK